jgi:hypothetical protein
MQRRGIITLIAAVLSFSSLIAAYAATTNTLLLPALTSYGLNGGMYNGSVWLRGDNSIYQYTGTGTPSLVYTIPTTVGGITFGSSDVPRTDVDSVTGIMYFPSRSGNLRVWSLDLNNLSNGPTLLFNGLSASTCNAGGIAKASQYIYFGCVTSTTTNKLYRITIPASGSPALTDADLTTIATSPRTKGFTDIAYRYQDGRIFAILGDGTSGADPAYIVRFSPAQAPTPTFTTVVSSSSGSYGVTGIALDTQGDLFYLRYSGSSATKTGFQLTSETATPSSDVVYYLTNNTTNYAYPYDWTMDAGSLATGSAVLGYVGSGYQSLVKVTGSAATSYATFNDLLIYPTTTSLTLPSGPFTFRQSYDLVGSSTTAGKITFWVNGKTLPNCKNVTINSSNSYTYTCRYKPSVHGAFQAYVSFIASDFHYLSSSSNIQTIAVVSRTTKR